MGMRKHNQWSKATRGLLLLVLIGLGVAAAVPLVAIGTGAKGGGGQETPPVAARSIENLAREEFERSLAEDPWPVTPRSAPASLMAGFACLPSCAANDGRFLAIANGAALVTLSEATLDVQVAAPFGTSTFTVGVFDGDAAVANGNWDVGTAPFQYTLFADPTRDGTGTTVAAGPFLSTAMTNNGWFDFTVTTDVSAETPSGNFFYTLRIENLDLAATTLNAFKLRTDGVATIEVSQQPFGFIASITSLADARIIYPSFPTVTPTTYDGSFDFLIDVATVNPELVVWDGDLDRGSATGLDLDTDDADTPGAPFLPFWATDDALSEGVAIGLAGTTGNPADDTTSVNFLRTPAITYQIIDPNGNAFVEDNPSGNQEWEQFRITTDAGDPTPFDEVAASLPAGVYTARALGVDMQNLNFWRFANPVLCIEESGTACTPLRSFNLGDLVWRDDNGNAVQDGEEPGLANVIVNLLDDDGDPIATTTTDFNGFYLFPIDAGTFTVEVDAANFEVGGALEGYTSTTGGETISNTVVDDNVLEYDFGYQGNGSIGNFVWFDLDLDGVQDGGEPGIGGVEIFLTEAGEDGEFDTGDEIPFGSQMTNSGGAYNFTGLPAGFYRVDVDESTLPFGVFLTTANEPYDLTLAANESFPDADFGYAGTGAIGDVVWFDGNLNEIQDGEPGLNGVTVTLAGDLNGDEIEDIVLTTVTANVGGIDGYYLFENLPPANCEPGGGGDEGLTGGSAKARQGGSSNLVEACRYTVTVDHTTLPPGVDTPTFDYDGPATPHQAVVLLEEGEINVDVDFGYVGAGAIGDTVWQDDDGNGIQTLGEPGLAGVTVELRDSADVLIASTVTDGDGNYFFTGLGVGTFTVTVVAATLPAGYTPTYDFDGIATPHVAVVTLGAGETNYDVDFGYQEAANGVIGDRVWRDDNGDGIQDGGEPGISGVTVTLRDSDGNVVATDVTDGNGNYGFSNLPLGDYTVEVDAGSLPAGVTTPTFDYDGTGTPHVAAVTLGANETNNDVDFGYRGNGAIGDRVWRDDNGDGIQDGDEPGISGVTVTLRDSGGNVVATDVTDGIGNYGFSNLPPGDYTVEVDAGTLPAGVPTPTFDYDGTGTPHVAAVTLGAGETNNDVDFGYRGNGVIGDRVWRDDNADGIQDGGEPGISGVTVYLTGSGGNLLATDVTDGNGNYGFSNLPPGTYRVEIDVPTVPAGYTPTYDFDGVGTPHVATVVLGPGATNNDVDFGYDQPVAPGSIGDRVWLDSNADGVQDGGEPGINGVTVTLLNGAGGVVATTVTSGDGNYGFPNLAPGTYTVVVDNGTLGLAVIQTYDLDGLATPHRATVTVGEGQDLTDVDFGYSDDSEICVDRAVSIFNDHSHALWLPGIGTDFIFSPVGQFEEFADGTARLTGTAVRVGAPTQRFVVDVTFSGRTGGTPPGSPKQELPASSYVENGGPIDHTTWYYYTVFSGTLAGAGDFAGALVEIERTGPAYQIGFGANNKNHNYGSSGWFLWDVVSQPTSGPSLVAAGQGDFNVDHVVCPEDAAIGDRIWGDVDADGVQDAGELGINGVTVNLFDGGGNLVATTVTSGDGLYTFAGLPAGAYTVRVDASTLPPALFPTFDYDGIGTAHEATVVVGVSEVNDDVDFGYQAAANVGDRVWLDADADGVQDGGEPGISGVTVRLRDSGGNVVATDVTDASGNYGFSGLRPGTYTVEVDATTLPAGYTPTYDFDGVGTPHVAAVTLAAGETNNGLDFGYDEPVVNGSIGDRVWKDLDADGVQDGGEPGINGVTVTLLDAGNNVVATAVTSGDGNYTFAGIGAGTYSVAVNPATLPAGLAQTYDLDGLATANRATFTLAPAENRTDVDFGYGQCGACKGKVSRLTLQYLGASSAFVEIFAKRGPNTDPVFSGTLTSGQVFEIVGPPTGGGGFANTLGTEVRIFVNGIQQTTIHTSCSQPIGPGMVSGDFKILAGSSLHGGLLCPMDPEEPPGGCGCEGKVSQLTLQYNGATSAQIQAIGNGGPNNATLFNGTVAAGGQFDLGTFTSGPGGFIGTVGTDVDLYVNGVFHVSIHTSCSQPIGPGLVRGDFVVVEGQSRTFPGPLCPVKDKGKEDCATPAEADAYGSDGGHAFWMPGISTRLVFQADSGRFIEYPDGTATLTGILVDANDASNVFEASVFLTGETNTTPPGSPKKELAAGAYVENGGPVDSNTWRYYEDYSGTLVGQGAWAGAVIEFDTVGPAFQVGMGANNKNVGYGASSWFTWNVVTQPSSGPTLQQTGQGDINVDLGTCVPGGGGPCEVHVRDEFNHESYDNDDGKNDWSGSWIEDDPDKDGKGPFEGNVSVKDGVLWLEDYPNTGKDPSAAREVDLEACCELSEAVLSFNYSTTSGVDASDAVVVEISSNGGDSFHVLETFTNITGARSGSRTYDILAWASSETQVRFRVSANYGSSNEHFKVDNVQIVAKGIDCDEEPPLTALLVVGKKDLNSGDAEALKRLEDLGFQVQIAEGTDVVTSDANNRTVVVISSTVSPTTVNTKFRNVAVPVVAWEHQLYDDLGMTGTVNNTDYGRQGSQKKLTVVNSGAMGMPGLDGTQNFTTSNKGFAWGKLNANAIVVARIFNSSTKSAIFGYEAGAAMPGLTAPARRVGLPLDDTATASFTTVGGQLFDGAILWAAGLD